MNIYCILSSPIMSRQTSNEGFLLAGLLTITKATPSCFCFWCFARILGAKKYKSPHTYCSSLLVPHNSLTNFPYKMYTRFITSFVGRYRCYGLVLQARYCFFSWSFSCISEITVCLTHFREHKCFTCSTSCGIFHVPTADVFIVKQTVEGGQSNCSHTNKKRPQCKLCPREIWGECRLRS